MTATGASMIGVLMAPQDGLGKPHCGLMVSQAPVQTKEISASFLHWHNYAGSDNSRPRFN